jgi:hypothetical protein
MGEAAPAAAGSGRRGAPGPPAWAPALASPDPLTSPAASSSLFAPSTARASTTGTDAWNPSPVGGTAAAWGGAARLWPDTRQATLDRRQRVLEAEHAVADQQLARLATEREASDAEYRATAAQLRQQYQRGAATATAYRLGLTAAALRQRLAQALVATEEQRVHRPPDQFEQGLADLRAKYQADGDLRAYRLGVTVLRSRLGRL